MAEAASHGPPPAGLSGAFVVEPASGHPCPAPVGEAAEAEYAEAERPRSIPRIACMDGAPRWRAPPTRL